VVKIGVYVAKQAKTNQSSH